MKKLATLLLCVLPLFAHSQIGISFDDTTYRGMVMIDTVHYHNNIWQVGGPHKATFDSAFMGHNAIVTDTVHPYLAADTSVFIIKAPKFLIPGLFMPFLYKIDFSYRLDMDSNAHAKLEYSADGGATWISVAKDTLEEFLVMPGAHPSLDTTMHGWKSFVYASFGLIDTATPDTGLFRFTFSSTRNDSNRDGWIIDEIGIEYWAEGAVHGVPNEKLISAYPNPTGGDVYIRSDQQYSTGRLTVTNAMGEEVYRNERFVPNQNVHLDVPDGTYFLQYTCGGEYCVKRIMVVR